MGEEEDQQQQQRHQPSVRFAASNNVTTTPVYSPRSNVPMTIKSALKHSVSSTSSAASGSTDSGFSLGSFSADNEGNETGRPAFYMILLLWGTPTRVIQSQPQVCSVVRSSSSLRVTFTNCREENSKRHCGEGQSRESLKSLPAADALQTSAKKCSLHKTQSYIIKAMLQCI